MTEDEMKDRISMALKDPVLQQGFEVICKENTELGKHNEKLIALINAERGRHEKCDDVHLRKIAELEKENAELKENNKSYKEIIDSSSASLMREKLRGYKQRTKAREIIQTFLGIVEAFGYSPSMDKFVSEAEQFLREVER